MSAAQIEEFISNNDSTSLQGPKEADESQASDKIDKTACGATFQESAHPSNAFFLNCEDSSTTNMDDMDLARFSPSAAKKPPAEIFENYGNTRKFPRKRKFFREKPDNDKRKIIANRGLTAKIDKKKLELLTLQIQQCQEEHTKKIELLNLEIKIKESECHTKKVG